jgi:5-methylcytosine-specific restriction endonuclease McrA
MAWDKNCVKSSKSVLADGYNYVPPLGKVRLRNVPFTLEQQAEIVARWEFHDATLEDLAQEFDCSITSIRYLLFPAKMNEMAVSWQQRHPEKNRDLVRKAVLKYQKSEKGRAYAKKYQEENAEKIKQWRLAWRARNADKLRANSQRRDLRYLSAEGEGWGELWSTVVEMWKNQCVYCGKENPDTVDHIVPLFKGGSNRRENLVPACRSCNCSKRIRSIEEFCPDRCEEIKWLAQAVADEFDRTV